MLKNSISLERLQCDERKRATQANWSCTKVDIGHEITTRPSQERSGMASGQGHVDRGSLAKVRTMYRAESIQLLRV